MTTPYGPVAEARVRAAVELDELMALGTKIGLTVAETAEVREAWIDYARRTPWSLDPAVIRSAVIARVNSMSWAPSVAAEL